MYANEFKTKKKQKLTEIKKLTATSTAGVALDAVFIKKTGSNLNFPMRLHGNSDLINLSPNSKTLL